MIVGIYFHTVTILVKWYYCNFFSILKLVFLEKRAKFGKNKMQRRKTTFLSRDLKKWPKNATLRFTVTYVIFPNNKHE